MFVIDDPEWAMNSLGNVLLAAEFPEGFRDLEGIVFSDTGSYIHFRDNSLAKIKVPKEILALSHAKANILVVSLRGGTILKEHCVPILRA